MIRFLKGVIETLGDDYLTMDVNGVGYELYASARLLAHVAEGEETKLSVYTHVREAEFSLFGFADEAERGLFMTLTGVNGVGPKVGLAILSALSVDEICDAITLQDGKMLTRASGVGPKLGDRIVLELKGKVASLGAGVPSGVTGGFVAKAPTGVPGEVLSALTNLGYKGAHAQQALKAASEKVGEGVAFDTLFKACLTELR